MLRLTDRPTSEAEPWLPWPKTGSGLRVEEEGSGHEDRKGDSVRNGSALEVQAQGPAQRRRD